MLRRDSNSALWGPRTALWVVAGMAFLIPPSWWAIRQIELRNDVESWLPTQDPQAQVVAWYHQHFPRCDRILLTWEGSSLADPRTPRIAQALLGQKDAHGIRRHGVKAVESVITPHDLLARMERHGVSRDEALQRLSGVLIGAGRIRVQLSVDGRERQPEVIERITSALRQEMDLICRVTPRVDAEEIDEDAAALEAESESAAEMANSEAEEETVVRPSEFVPRPYDLEVSWNGMSTQPAEVEKAIRLIALLRLPRSAGVSSDSPAVSACFREVGTPIALAVGLTEAGAADATTSLRTVREAVARAGIPEDSLRMAGGPVAGSALNAAVKRVAWNAAAPWSRPMSRSALATSALVSIALAVLLLKSLRLALMVLAVSGLTTFVTVALVPVTSGSMNMVLVVMPALLLVVTISGAIHVGNYWQHEAARKLDGASGRSVAAAAIPCLLASLTTAIGLASLGTSPLSPVRDFGVYSAIGCLISLGAVLYGLPALLQWMPARGRSEEEAGGEWRWFGQFVIRRSKPILFIAAASFAVAILGLKHFKTETRVIKYFPETARIVGDYEFIENELAGIFPVELLVQFDGDALSRLNFLERMEVVRAVGEKVRGHSEVSGALSLADFQPVNEVPAEGASFLVKAKYNKKSAVMEERVRDGEGDERGAASFVQTVTTPLRADVGQNRFSSQSGDELWRLTAHVNILRPEDHLRITGEIEDAARSVLKYHAGASHVVTGTMPLFLRTQKAVLDSLIESFAMSFALISLVMVSVLRSPTAGILAMAPNLLPVGLVFGVVSWMRIPVDIGTMLTASVALGIAVDGTLHLLTWFRNALRSGMTRTEAIEAGVSHCGPAMTQTSLVIVLGLLALASADLLLVSRFGWLMAGIVFAALIADLIVTPALLAGPLGAILERVEASRTTTAPGPIDRVLDLVNSTPVEESRARPVRPYAMAAPRRPHGARRP